MKKKIFGVIAVLAIAVVAAWNVNIKSRTNGMSNVIMANVEALAQESNIPFPSCSCSKKCSDGITTASCTGYNSCYCNSGASFVECDGVSSHC